MGIDTEIKRTLLTPYHGVATSLGAHRKLREFLYDRAGAVETVARASRASQAYPPIICLDHTASIKWLSPDVTSGHQYFSQCVLRRVTAHFNDGGRVAYMCFDRGSPPNKALEHQARYANLVTMEVPQYEGISIISDHMIPTQEEWSGFVNNKQLVGDLQHYITQRILEEQADPNNTFTPPPGCYMALHGGSTLFYQGTVKPNRTVVPIPMAEPTVYFVECAEEEYEGLGGIRLKKNIRKTGIFDKFPADEVDALLEGEIACLYFARQHPTENIHFVSPDGDLLLQLLLMAPDRIDPATGNFRNCHYLELTMAGGSDFVDINQLYIELMNAEEYKALRNPVLTLAALGCLVKNDYVKGYCPGIKSIDEVPAVFQTLRDNSLKYRNLVSLLPNQRGDPNTPCIVHIDEELFVQFTHDMYLAKYRETVAKKLKMAWVTIAEVKKHLDGFKKASYRIMSNDAISVIVRQLLWVLEYWHNGYRQHCIVYPPQAKFLGQPYYGWSVEASGHCLPSNVVSPPMPHRLESLQGGYKRSYDDLVRSIQTKEEDEDNGERAAEHRHKRARVDKAIAAPNNVPHLLVPPTPVVDFLVS